MNDRMPCTGHELRCPPCLKGKIQHPGELLGARDCKYRVRWPHAGKLFLYRYLPTICLDRLKTPISVQTDIPIILRGNMNQHMLSKKS